MALAIVAAWGVRGDVMPYVAVGAELKRRGHDVTLISNPVYEQQAQEAALSFVRVGTAEQFHAFVEDAGLWDRNTAVTSLVKHYLPTVEGSYDAVVRTHRPEETILLANGHGAWIAREKLDIPAVAFRVSPGALSRLDPRHPSRPFPVWANRVVRSGWGLRLLHELKSQRDRLRALRGRPAVSGSVQALAAEVSRVRVLAGLGEYPVSVEAVRPELTICLWPSWFSPPQKDWPPGTRISGFPFYPKPPARTAALGSAEASRLVVFMRGSAASHQKAFFAEAVRCCLQLGRPGVLIAPHAADVPRELPSGVSHVPFAPLWELFGRAAAVVHHGGIGTMAYAFAAGIPQVVVPIVGEQFDLGYRMERLGVGSMLTQTPLTAARLARELQSLWGSDKVRRRCRVLRDQVDSEAGCSLAADWIEELIASRQSLTLGRA